MSNLNFKEDFTRLSLADVHAMNTQAIELYEGYTIDGIKGLAAFFYKVAAATSAEMERRIIEKFSPNDALLEEKRTLPIDGIDPDADRKYAEFMTTKL